MSESLCFPLKFLLNSLKKCLTQIYFPKGPPHHTMSSRSRPAMNIASPEEARVVKRRRARSAKPCRDATRSGGGKGPTKGRAPCAKQCRGKSPQKILPCVRCSLEAIEREQSKTKPKKERKNVTLWEKQA